MFKRLFFLIIVALFTTDTAFAAHPLITDDAETQGRGKSELQFAGEYGHDSENGITTNTLVFPTIPELSYGISETVDLIFGVSHERIEIKQADDTTTERGISDTSIQLKWRFYEKDGLSMAVKPGFTLPTGEEDKGLGNGKASYSVFFITTKDMTPWAFHFNLGYLHDDYRLLSDDEANRSDIWHVSLALQLEVVKNFKVVSDIGMERNRDKASDTNPAFLLGGLIYSIRENLDVDFGIKDALNKAETDISYLAGITWSL